MSEAVWTILWMAFAVVVFGGGCTIYSNRYPWEH